MIENPLPKDWRELQAGVKRIFSEIGLRADQDHLVSTPRGSVALDVYAVDGGSVDRISYVVECKNWESRIPQSVVHAFTTVMHELGANIGYIVSREGLQAGAERYTNCTNIRGVTFEQFQRHYFGVWFERHFVPILGVTVDPLSQYTEPFNTYRDRKADALPPERRERFLALLSDYQTFGMFMTFFEFPKYSRQFAIPPPDDIEAFKIHLQKPLEGKIALVSVFYRDLLAEMIALVQKVTEQFDEVFGGRIFDPPPTSPNQSLKRTPEAPSVDGLGR